MKKQVIDFGRFQEMGGFNMIELRRRSRICSMIAGSLDDHYNLTLLDVYRAICKHLSPGRPWSTEGIVQSAIAEFPEYSGIIIYEDSPWERMVLSCNCRIAVHKECINGDWVPVPWLD